MFINVNLAKIYFMICKPVLMSCEVNKVAYFVYKYLDIVKINCK